MEKHTNRIRNKRSISSASTISSSSSSSSRNQKKSSHHSSPLSASISRPATAILMRPATAPSASQQHQPPRTNTSHYSTKKQLIRPATAPQSSIHWQQIISTQETQRTFDASSSPESPYSRSASSPISTLSQQSGDENFSHLLYSSSSEDSLTEAQLVPLPEDDDYFESKCWRRTARGGGHQSCLVILSVQSSIF